jgi:hypothetical protein
LGFLFQDGAFTTSHTLRPVGKSPSGLRGGQRFDDLDQTLLGLGEQSRFDIGGLQETMGLIPRDPQRRPGLMDMWGSGRSMSQTDQTSSSTSSHPTTMDQKSGQRRETLPARPRNLIEPGQPAGPLRLQQTTGQLQFDQIIRQIIDTGLGQILTGPLLQSRPKTTHVLSPNICSTLHDGWDRF